MDDWNMTVAEVADFAGCHRNTVLKYERQGYIKAMRDHNDFRRFSRSSAKRLKALLSIRKEAA